MTTTDSVLFVKETQTCQYILHIATPRLCGEPGFRSHRDAHEEAYIRCREVMSPEQYAQADKSLPEASHPIKMPSRPPKPVIAPPPPAEEAPEPTEEGKKSKQNEVIRKALEKLIAGGDLKAGEITVIEDGDDEVLIEFLDYGDGDDLPSLQEILQAHLDEAREKASKRSEPNEAEKKRHQASRDPSAHDEL